MKNCLKTQLKSIVNNDKLVYLGSIIIRVSASTNPEVGSYTLFLKAKEGKTVTFKPIGAGLTIGGTYYASGQEITIVTEQEVTIILDNADFKLVIYNKYNLAVISDYTLVAHNYTFDFTYINESLEDINIELHNTPAEGNVSYLGSVLDIGSSNIDNSYLDLNCVPISNNIKVFGKRKVTGNLALFNTKTKLETLKSANNININGDVKNLLDAQVIAGRTQGSLLLMLANSSCTYNGVPITYESMNNHWSIMVTFDSSVPGGYSVQFL